MPDNVLIPLPGFRLPADFPWRVRFITAVEDQLKRLRATGHFSPPRFFGYFFRGGEPVGVSGNWMVTLDSVRPVCELPAKIDRLTHGQYNITSDARENTPEFLLVHDRRDGACWLWRFSYGLRFVEATEPVEGNGGGDGTAWGWGNRKLLGP